MTLSDICFSVCLSRTSAAPNNRLRIRWVYRSLRDSLAQWWSDAQQASWIAKFTKYVDWNVTSAFLLTAREYWLHRTDERLCDLPPKVDPGAFSGQRQRWKTLRGLCWCTCFCMCSGSALLEDLLGVSCRSILGSSSVCYLYRLLLLITDTLTVF